LLLLTSVLSFPCAFPPPLFEPLQGLQQATWPEAFAAVQRAASRLQGSEMRAVAGKLADAESMVCLKDLMNRLGCGDLRVSFWEVAPGTCWLLG